MKTETVITTDEVAAVNQWNWEMTDYWLRAVNARVVKDWAGRDAISAEDAQRAVEAWKKHAEEEARVASLYDSYTRSRAEQRRQAGEEAWQRELERAHAEQHRAMVQATEEGRTIYTGRTPLSGRTIRAAQEAYATALAEYDRRNPLLAMEDFAKKEARKR